MPKPPEGNQLASEANNQPPRADVGTSSSDLDELLGECLERFSRCAPVKHPEQLVAFLPDANERIRQFVLIELIKMDMAIAAEGSDLRLIDFYLQDFQKDASLGETPLQRTSSLGETRLRDILPPSEVPLDLVMEEIQLRKQLGQVLEQAEYQQRFPQFEAMLGHMQQTSEATMAVRNIQPPPNYAPHTEIDDFLIIQQVGQGAFASVYLAKQLTMQRPVALKVSRGKGDESQSLARFDHANIVRIYDQRHLPEPQVQLLYMQFLPGGTLADVIARVRQPAERTGQTYLESVDACLFRTAQLVPDSSATRQWIAGSEWAEVVAWVGTQLALALQHAHSHGVMHRDVKPANVLLTAEGVPKLADFNVSYAGAAGRAGAAASFGGSIGYMAPEHLRAIQSVGELVGEKVEEPADLYSLSVLLWELWQGVRPFDVPRSVTSWSDAVAQQLDSRAAPLIQPQAAASSSERALEKVLRHALSYWPKDRPRSGAELAGRLKLSLHPEAARIFDIASSPWRAFLLKCSPWLVSIVVILTPNIVGGLLNFQYNYHQVMTERMRDDLTKLSWLVNAIFFPVGAALIVYFALTLIRAVGASKRGYDVSAKDIHDTLQLGHRAAVIGGSLWLVGGITIPLALHLMSTGLTTDQAIHLLISSLICGGVAMIYPFFGMAAVTTWIYYPLYVTKSMQDTAFERHRWWITRQGEVYLLVAALVPLLGAALTSWHGSSQVFTLVAIGAGALGLVASFFVQRAIAKAWSQMAEVLSATRT